MQRATCHRIALVVGGTGKTGRRVAQRLRARGIETLAGSRSGDTRFDWEDPSTWESAIGSADLVYLTYSPDLAIPEAPPAIQDFARLAAERGVERLVLLSGRGEEEAQRCERIVHEVNPDWTVVRASWFSQNFSEGFFVDGLRHGLLALPVGAVKEPFIDAEDIADVVEVALTEPGHEGRIYEVTGPRLLTFADAVAEISAETGRDLRFAEISLEQFVAQMGELEMPDSLTRLTTYLFETVLDGRNAHLADGVCQALARAPRDFSDFVRRTAAAGAWAEPSSVGSL